jgi:hypothetical protein
VLSPEFMHDPMCDFFVKFAHSLSPGSRSKKLIPVLTERCYIPQILRYITLVDHTKSDLQVNASQVKVVSLLSGYFYFDCSSV